MATRVRRAPKNPMKSIRRKTQPVESLVTSAVTRYDGWRADATVDLFNHRLWEHATKNQRGVIGWDPVGHRIGWSYRDGWLVNYTPMSAYKQTIVGRCLDYTFYDDFGTGDEADWCIFIDPDPPYAFIRDEVVKLIPSHNRDDLQVVAGKVCVECEITPDEKWYDNGYFGKTDHKSPNLGKTLGLYGPWVRDGGHSGRPEIHPCELVWWKDDLGAGGLPKWTFLVVQDDSNRFDRESDYDGDSVIRAWSAPPRNAAFTVALELRHGYQANFELSVRRHRNMAVLEPPTTTTDPADYVISAEYAPSGGGRIPIGGAVLKTVGVQVTKRITRERDIGPGDTRGLMRSGPRTIPKAPDTTSPGMLKASLSRIAASPSQNSVYRCFLNFEVQVGTTNDRGGEGYAEIVLQQKPSTGLGGVVVATDMVINR